MRKIRGNNQDKIRRLKKDKIFVKDGKIVDFKNMLFEDFKTDFPLKNRIIKLA